MHYCFLTNILKFKTQIKALLHTRNYPSDKQEMHHIMYLQT